MDALPNSLGRSADLAVSLMELQQELTRCSKLIRTLELRDARSGLPPAALHVLGTLNAMGPATVPAIARARGTSRQNIQIIVNKLSLHGLVSAIPNAAHKRSARMELTARGKQLLLTAESGSQLPAFADFCADSIKVAEIRQTLALLSKLQQRAAEWQQQRTTAPLDSGARSVTQSYQSPPVPKGIAAANFGNDLPFNLL